MKKIFFIVNTAAGNGKGMKVWNKIKSELDSKDVNYRSFFTKAPKHAEELVKQVVSMHGESIGAIVAVGGDGTINEVVNGLPVSSKVKVGYIPAGSGNDFTRGFLIPKSPIDALHFILKSVNKEITPFDIGSFKVANRSISRRFISSFGVGFDAEVSQKTNQSRIKGYFNKIYLGSLAYILILVKLLFTHKRESMSLTIDGSVFHYENVWFVTVSNQSYFGGGMKIAPAAFPDDGLLHVTILHNLSRVKLLLIFGVVFFGKHTLFKEVDVLKGENIVIDCEKKILAHADGEIVGHTPVSISIQKRKVSFIARHTKR
ncbi:diacylglycerol kinase family lipid kinase [Bacillus timonensis]|nr:diacylglycerol kinase family lipid kinase [Bacillus timonensis]